MNQGCKCFRGCWESIKSSPNLIDGQWRVTIFKYFVVLAVVVGTLAYLTDAGFKTWVDRVDKNAELINLLTFASVLLTLLGILGAKRQLRVQERTLEHLTTKPIGWFPRHLTEIQNIVKRAKHELHVIADAADYGSFFAPSEHRDLINEIITARLRRKKLTVHMLIAGAGESITQNTTFFQKTLRELLNGDNRLQGGETFKKYVERYIYVLREEEERDFREWLCDTVKNDDLRTEVDIAVERAISHLDGRDGSAMENYEVRLERCKKICDSSSRAESKECLGPGDDQYFHTLLQLRRLWFKYKLKANGVKIAYINQDKQEVHAACANDETRAKARRGSCAEVIHFWVGDQRDAVFTFALAGKKVGRGFRTRDPAIVEDVLEEIFKDRLEGYEKEAANCKKGGT